MLAAPVVAALGGCTRDNDNVNASPTPSARGGTLKVILHGPFVVVIDAEGHRVKAFLPYDDDGLHQLRVATSKGVVVKDESEARKSRGYQFTLEDPEHDLDVDLLPRHIDAGFDDFRLREKPRQDASFVTVELPMPELITFFPPPVPVQFVKSRLGMMPTNHVFEYRVRDFDKLSKVLLNTPQGPMAPLSCSDLLGQYEAHWKGLTRGYESRQRSHIQAELDVCEKTQVQAFFIGVGLPPTSPSYLKSPALHALDFFNKKLLPLFPESRERQRLMLAEVDVKPCPTQKPRPTYKSSWAAPTLIPAVQRYMMPEPRLLPVSSADDCRAGGLLVGP